MTLRVLCILGQISFHRGHGLSCLSSTDTPQEIHPLGKQGISPQRVYRHVVGAWSSYFLVNQKIQHFRFPHSNIIYITDQLWYS